MALDSDWAKAMGDDYVALQGSSATPPVEATPTTQPTDAPAAVSEEVIAEAVTTTPEQIVADEAAKQIVAEQKVEEDLNKQPEKTPEEEADAIINELLGTAETAVAEVKEQGQDIAKSADVTPELKQKVEEYEIKIGDMTTKLGAVTKAYRDLLDEKVALENTNEEYNRKLQIVSDNPLLQDLLRGLYLKDKDPSAVANVESALKTMLKEYSSIDIDDLINKARGAGAKGLGTSAADTALGDGGTYDGLFGEGDMVKLS